MINLKKEWCERIEEDKKYNLQKMSEEKIWLWRLNNVSMSYCAFISRGKYYNVKDKVLYYYYNLIPKELKIIINKFDLYLEKVCISKKLHYDYFIKYCPKELLKIIKKDEIKEYLKYNFNQDSYIFYNNKKGKMEMCTDYLSYSSKSDYDILEENLISIKPKKMVIIFEDEIKGKEYIRGIKFIFKHIIYKAPFNSIENTPAKRRLEIFRRDKYICQYCKWKNGLPNTKDRVLTIDHKIPIAFGGTNKKENLITCCLNCNAKKHDNILPEDIRISQLTLLK